MRNWSHSPLLFCCRGCWQLTTYTALWPVCRCRLVWEVLRSTFRGVFLSDLRMSLPMPACLLGLRENQSPKFLSVETTGVICYLSLWECPQRPVNFAKHSWWKMFTSLWNLISRFWVKITEILGITMVFQVKSSWCFMHAAPHHDDGSSNADKKNAQSSS